ncbi:uncharacterized protein LOC126653495 isoform X2 [Mercurialis annua]|uniref:uncharacterized protein LOC126653495 isoform X2 n=1 Tax=Mercurialis annua TaxID=3986 RepID=UPI00215F4832|nr:uncharacterized protein LOC126653495 isoform X2 [Mercurialis annua]
MVKSKEEEEGNKSDGLEIISIGSLYSGTWDKKYWSSSRGKDRYPYPVGYQACRAYNGSTYKMEIQEGSKGPLFLITSADGHSCSGQTADIAWEKFQKKGCLRVNILHGKRFSCKIDGIEFFGFRNPLVQRLLRELVANVNGIAEQSLVSSSFCIVAPTIDPNSEYHDPSTSSNLSVLEKPHLTRKRVKRGNNKPSGCDDFKRLCAGDVTYGSRKKKKSVPASTIIFNEMHDSCIPLSPVLAGLQSNCPTGKENICSSDKDGLLLKFDDYPNDVREKVVLAERVRKPDNYENNKSTNVVSNSCAEEKPLDRLQDTEEVISELKAVDALCPDESQTVDDVDLCVPDTELEGLNFPVSSKFKNVTDPCPEECQSVLAVHLCAPDTLDSVQDNTTSSATVILDKITCGAAEEFMVNDLCVPDTELEGLNFPVSSEFKIEADPCPEECKNIIAVHLCAPDTLDFVQDNTKKSATIMLDKFTCGVEEEFMVTDPVVSEQLVTKSSPEEESGTFSSNFSSEKSDMDSVGHDIAKSMMTLLLPQAIPLLNITSRKKIKTPSPSVNFDIKPKLHEENIGSGSSIKAQSSDINHSVIQSYGHVKSVALDKFGGDQFQDQVMNQLVSPSKNVEADQVSFGKDASCLHGGKRHADLDIKGSLAYHVETNETKDILCDDKVQLNERKMAQGGEFHLSEFVLNRKSSSKEVPTIVSHDVRQNINENSLGAKINSEKNLETAPDCNEGTSAASVGALASLQLSRKESLEAGDFVTSKISSGQVSKRVYTRKKVPKTEAIRRKNSPLLLESAGCSKLIDGCTAGTTGTALNSELFNDQKEVVYTDTRVGGELHGLSTENTDVTSNPVLESRAPFMSVNQADFCASEDQDTSNPSVPSVLDVEKSQIHLSEKIAGLKNSLDINRLASREEGIRFCHKDSNSEITRQMNLEFNCELDSIVDFLGCYFHPMPVLSLLLSRKGNEIYICSLCGLLVEKDRTLFLYKLVIEGPGTGCPCFIGHTSITWPSSADKFGGVIPFERSGLQLTPDGQCLVLLGNTRTPCCREGTLDCLCSSCTLDCSENNGVKIVQVKAGYVSVLVKLSTSDSLLCILVCEPDHIVAAGENGKLHLWTMNSLWSAPTEDFTIQSNDHISPCTMELKRIPKCSSLVIGHDGLGQFRLWDISKRILVSKFSAPSISVHQFCPISVLFRQREVNGFSYSNMEVDINTLLDATKMCFSEHSMNHSRPHSENEDISIWCLVFTAPHSDALHDYGSSDFLINSVGGWRVALLVKDTLILGNALDPRAAAIGASAGHGIIGTLDGLVYMWEILTGKVLGTLHKFKGGSASCIATDGSGSGVLAVADDKGQVLVYMCPQRV